MASIFFTSLDHKQRFIAAIRGIGKIDAGKLDPEYASVLYILTSSAGTWQKASDYVSREGIDMKAMLEGVDFSGGYSVLMLLAGNLFNSQQHIDPVELMRLDDRNFTLAMTALQIRRASLYEK